MPVPAVTAEPVLARGVAAEAALVSGVSAEPAAPTSAPVPVLDIADESPARPQTAAVIRARALDVLRKVAGVVTAVRVAASRTAEWGQAWREPIVRLAWRGATAAAVIVVLGTAGWAAKSYWTNRAAAPKTGTARFESVPPGAAVFVDGKPVGNAPLAQELDPGTHTVEFRRRDETRKLTVDVTAGGSTLSRIDWSVKATGRLQVESDPPGAAVIIDGRNRGVTPLTLDDLTVGSHTVVLQGAKGSVRRSVTVTADGTAQLAEAIYSGWLHVSSPIDLQISTGGRGLRLDERNQALLPPGSHELRFENRAFGFTAVRQVVVEPGKTASVSIVPAPSPLTVNTTAPAEVFVDGEKVGDAPLANHPLRLGTHEVMVKAASGAERRFSVTATVAPVQLDVDFSQP